jgi:mitochondrial import receptor subunit TOM20
MPGREEAQAKFIEFLRGEARAYNAPHLLARFLGRQIAVETAKMIPGGGSSVYMDDLPPVDQSTGMDYGLWDHVERLRFLAVTVPDEEHDIMKEVLSTALPGLVRLFRNYYLYFSHQYAQESFLTDERHATLKGKLLYNAFGICPEHEVCGILTIHDQRLKVKL